MNKTTKAYILLFAIFIIVHQSILIKYVIPELVLYIILLSFVLIAISKTVIELIGMVSSIIKKSYIKARLLNFVGALFGLFIVLIFSGLLAGSSGCSTVLARVDKDDQAFIVYEELLNGSKYAEYFKSKLWNSDALIPVVNYDQAYISFFNNDSYGGFLHLSDSDTNKSVTFTIHENKIIEDFFGMTNIMTGEDFISSAGKENTKAMFGEQFKLFDQMALGYTLSPRDLKCGITNIARNNIDLFKSLSLLILKSIEGPFTLEHVYEMAGKNKGYLQTGIDDEGLSVYNAYKVIQPEQSYILQTTFKAPKTNSPHYLNLMSEQNISLAPTQSPMWLIKLEKLIANKDKSSCTNAYDELAASGFTTKSTNKFKQLCDSF
jgi:hypothetical protein